MHNLPFGRPGRFYRGNLHTHSTNSDGTHAPDRVIAYYRDAGYDFLALTDHFIERYGWPVSDTRGLRSDDFTTLIAAELHAPETSIGETWHIEAIGLPLDFAPPVNGETGPDLAARAAAAGAFIGIVHPSWYGLTSDDARTIPCAHAIEIYNHGSAVELDRGSDWPFCDALLNEGWRLSGYASDDAHHLTHDSLGGWVQVHAESLDPALLLEALKAGRYYSSQGPEIAARAAEAGAFIGLVHPSWYGLTVEDAREIPFAHAIEIYNHGNAVEVDRGDDWPFCDQLLNGGWRLSGYAADDAHYLSHDCLGGWVQVKSDSPEPDALLDALKAGRYYSSQGPEIHDIRIEDGEVRVACSPASAIIISGRGSKADYRRGEDLSAASFPLARYQSAFYRITVVDGEGKKAWSNPIWQH